MSEKAKRKITMNPFKKVVSKLYLKLYLKWSGRQKELYDFFKEMSKVKNIMLFLSENQLGQKEVLGFMDSLRKLFKRSKIKTFTKTQMKDHDFNWLGIPKKSYLKFLEIQSFDLLIDLNSSADLEYYYIVAKSGIHIRMNLFQSKYDYVYNFHINIKPTKPLEEQLETILIHLQNLSGRQKSD
jgi:hypothetical protein